MPHDPKTRSSLMETRNPLLSLTSYKRLLELPPEVQQALRDVLGDMREDASNRAEEGWRRRKAPIATYWRCVATYALHLRRDLARQGAGRPFKPVPRSGRAGA